MAVVLALVVVAIATFLLIRSRRSQPQADPSTVMQELRERLFTADSAEIGITPIPGEAWGIVMDMGQPTTVVTLMSLSDGSASLYFSTGGGIIGGEGQPPVREAAVAFVRVASANLGHLKQVSAHPLPAPGQTSFYVFTPEGVFGAEVAEQDLGQGRHALSPLFQAGQGVITQFRLTEDGKGHS